MGRRSVGAGPTVGGDTDMMRLVAELYYLRDHSQPEIAAVTGELPMLSVSCTRESWVKCPAT